LECIEGEVVRIGGIAMRDGTDQRRWEYLTIPEAQRSRLGELGADGWELVAAGGSASEPVLYLKRPAPSFRERVTLAQRREVYRSRGLDAELDREPQS
jgi:hypothetical protein